MLVPVSSPLGYIGLFAYHANWVELKHKDTSYIQASKYVLKGTAAS